VWKSLPFLASSSSFLDCFGAGASSHHTHTRDTKQHDTTFSTHDNTATMALKVGFIGAGMMAEALAGGFDKAGVAAFTDMVGLALFTHVILHCQNTVSIIDDSRHGPHNQSDTRE
jgi:hypothetical protein